MNSTQRMSMKSDRTQGNGSSPNGFDIDPRLWRQSADSWQNNCWQPVGSSPFVHSWKWRSALAKPNVAERGEQTTWMRLLSLSLSHSLSLSLSKALSNNLI